MSHNQTLVFLRIIEWGVANDIWVV